MCNVHIRVVQFNYFGSRGPIKLVKVLEPSLFEQFDVQFRKWRILLVSMVILVQNMLVLTYMYIIYYKKKSERLMAI
jgi:hypothetical protein